MTNKELLNKYPWLTPFNSFSWKLITDCAGPDGEEGYWPGNPTAHPDYDYEYTLLDNLADGWRKAFGAQMCEDIDSVIKSWPEKEQRDFRITDIKEKWGHLCIYTNFSDENLERVISKYVLISRLTCIHCGGPARWVSRGWYMPYCQECAEEQMRSIRSLYSAQANWDAEFMDIDEYYRRV